MMSWKSNDQSVWHAAATYLSHYLVVLGCLSCIGSVLFVDGHQLDSVNKIICGC